jgi:hypothetical protein
MIHIPNPVFQPDAEIVHIGEGLAATPIGHQLSVCSMFVTFTNRDSLSSTVPGEAFAKI